MEKVLMIDPDKCTGCRMCEQVCSVSHEGTVNPYRSRIRVLKWEMEGGVLPMVCQQCDDPPCLNVCPMGAISKDADSGVVSIDYDKCIGCRMCMFACPFGAMGYDWVDRKVIKCDLCQGDPQCVRFCDPGAVSLVEKQQSRETKMKAAAERIRKVMADTGAESC
jgi:Fe-S-cluster-containing hydrogenase component 2